ncbi:MAG: carboxypeptidase-like regulatory domain-containing protein, partial [Bacteroidia bacterium]
MKKHLLFLCFQLIFLLGIGQTVNVHGYVIDAESGDNLPYASVYDSISEQRALCNDYGFFSMKIPKGTVKLKASFASYQSASLSLTLRADTLLSIGLVPGSVDEVLIEAERGAARPIIGRINVPIAQLTEIPTIGGEKDPLKAIVLLPGISQGTEASTGFRVRGGGPDQNLILLDETPVYNVSHLFGFISVFNANAIKSIDLYKGGFPARYGGRLSSVVNVQMKEGNVEKRKTAFGIGLLSSHYHQEGPLKKLGDRSSYLISARASYAGIVSLPVWAVFRAGQTDYYLNYWLLDLNAKIQHQFAKGGKLYWSTYIGNDDWRGREGEARVSETQ